MVHLSALAVGKCRRISLEHRHLFRWQKFKATLPRTLYRLCIFLSIYKQARKGELDRLLRRMGPRQETLDKKMEAAQTEKMTNCPELNPG